MNDPAHTHSAHGSLRARMITLFLDVVFRLRTEPVSVIPSPTDAPSVTLGGDARKRILVLGSGPALGLGVTSHSLALTGALARALARHSGRGVTVDTIADPQITARHLARHLDQVLGLERMPSYDAIVLTLGRREAFTLTPLPAWERDLGDLVGQLRTYSAELTEILILGTSPLRPTIRSGPLGGLAARHSLSLNRASSALCQGNPRTTYLPPTSGPVSATLNQVTARTFYASVARAITTQLGPALDAQGSARWSRTARALRPLEWEL